MFAKILVAMDCSAIGKDVFDAALTLATTLRANLMLLHVLSAEEVDSPNVPLFPNLEYYPTLSDRRLELYHEQWQAFEQRGLELLQSRANQAIAAGINTEFSQTPGSPGRTICDLARNWDADVIVMGRRGRSGLSELVLGSVSNYVLHHAPCSVLAIQHPEKSGTQPRQHQSATISPG